MDDIGSKYVWEFVFDDQTFASEMKGHFRNIIDSAIKYGYEYEVPSRLKGLVAGREEVLALDMKKVVRNYDDMRLDSLYFSDVDYGEEGVSTYISMKRSSRIRVVDNIPFSFERDGDLVMNVIEPSILVQNSPGGVEARLVCHIPYKGDRGVDSENMNYFVNNEIECKIAGILEKEDTVFFHGGGELLAGYKSIGQMAVIAMQYFDLMKK